MSFSLLQSVSSGLGFGAENLAGQPVVLLGDVIFDGLELPERFPFGGEQGLVVHRLAGGKRIVDAMGPNDGAISWEGRLFGQSAHLKALRLDLMRRSGRAVELSVGLRAWKVVVSSFVARMEDPFLVSYTLECTVIEDLLAGESAEQEATLEEAVAMDLAWAEEVAATMDAVMQATSVVTGIILAVAPGGAGITSLPPEDMAQARDSAASAAAAAFSIAVAADAALAGPLGLMQAAPAMLALDAAAAITASADAADEGYKARQAGAAMTRVQQNLEAA